MYGKIRQIKQYKGKIRRKNSKAYQRTITKIQIEIEEDMSVKYYVNINEDSGLPYSCEIILGENAFNSKEDLIKNL